MINTIEVKCHLKTLMQVLNATGKPELAIAMLNDEYQQPYIVENKVGRWDNKKYNTVIVNDSGEEESVEMEERIPIIYTFVSYCPFSNDVTFKRSDGWKRLDKMSLDGWESLEDAYALM